MCNKYGDTYIVLPKPRHKARHSASDFLSLFWDSVPWVIQTGEREGKKQEDRRGHERCSHSFCRSRALL